MAKPDFAGQPTINIVGDTFDFQAGRLSGTGTLDLDAGTFSIVTAQVELPSGETLSLNAADHFVDHPIPPPVFDFLI
jgi:hypothetical protein